MIESRQTDSYVSQYLANFRQYYPGILEWYSGLHDDFTEGHRHMFVARNGSDIQGLAITKKGPRSKLCHISVSSTARRRGLGNMLMHQALSDMIYQGAREIYVTTSEKVYYDHAPFFLNAGFEVIDWQLHRYQRGVSEIIWRLDVNPELESPCRYPFDSC